MAVSLGWWRVLNRSQKPWETSHHHRQSAHGRKAYEIYGNVMCLYIYVYICICTYICTWLCHGAQWLRGSCQYKGEYFFKINFTRAPLLAQYTGGTQNHDGYLCNSSSSGGDSWQE
jgi:hypothetical protein